MKTIELSEFIADPSEVVRQATQGALFSVVADGREQIRILPPRPELPAALRPAPIISKPNPGPHAWIKGRGDHSVHIVGDIVAPTPPEEYGSLI